MDYSAKLLLIQYLFGIALADGQHDPSEISLIQSISGYIGISRNDYESVKAMFIKDTGSAYKILEVSPDATDDEIKKAYRELAKKYHPDKVSHLGNDVRMAAEEKFTKLNAAYEAVKQERGMN
jgi:DnaJ like chaperone protein